MNVHPPLVKKKLCALECVVRRKCRGIGQVTIRQRRRPPADSSSGRGKAAVFRWGVDPFSPPPREGPALEGTIIEFAGSNGSK